MTEIMADSQQEEEEEREMEESMITTTARNNNSSMSRKEKRKVLKKMKRKQLRKEMAMKEREEEEKRLNSPEEQMKLLRLEQEEAERMARERIEFEEREKQFLRELEQKNKRQEEEEEQRKLFEESQRELGNNENAIEVNEDDDWEYVEEGPAEIIWKGNEIIVKKKKVRVPKRAPDTQKEKQESERPISNPLAPQSEAFEDYRSAQEVLETVAQQVPNFGTEQDKAHCPFHLKTGVCRFGARCSRVHFYPDKACTLLMKNMYNGPGLAWEQDEGLEYTEEEVERSFEDFYEDVHTEFLKFGEIVNFKVCKNGSSHLRGNVYVHYKSLESAMLAYQYINGRFFAGKQLTCEFVNVTRWRIAICGEYMKSRLKACSRGSACNFIHCFRNPGGDYEWADWDKPPPRYWLKEMAALFGYTADGFTDEVSPGYHPRRSRSRGLDSPHRKCEDDDGHRSRHLWRHRDEGREASDFNEREEKQKYQDYRYIKHRESDNFDISDRSNDGRRDIAGVKRSSRKRGEESESRRQDSKSRKEGRSFFAEEAGVSDRYLEYKKRSSSRQKIVSKSIHEHGLQKADKFDQEDKFQKKKEADSSNINDNLDSEEDRHHCCKKRRKENEAELSSSASDESRISRIEKRQQKNRGNIPRLKKKDSDRDSPNKFEDGKHIHPQRSSRERENISESANGRDRHGRDEKGPQKNVRKSSRPKKQSGSSNTESDRDKHRLCRHSSYRKKHLRQLEHDTDSSDSTFDGRKLGRHEKKPQKSRKISSRFNKESDFTDKESNVERNCEASASRYRETPMAPIKGQDFDDKTEAELEKAYRHAALKRLEEIKKHKDTQAVHSREPIESSRICTHDSIVVKVVEARRVLEESASSKMETNVASIKRKRI